MAYRLTETAERQIDRVLLDSARNYGLEAADRYGLLLLVAMAAVGNDPGLPGSIQIPRLIGIRAYPVRLSRRRVEAIYRVRQPRHIIVYRVGADGMVDIVGIVHDRMVLSRAARRAMREIGER